MWILFIALSALSIPKMDTSFRGGSVNSKVGWNELSAVSLSLSKFDEHIGKMARAKSPLSRFRILQQLVEQSADLSFSAGERMISLKGDGYKCRKPVLSWETESRLTSIQSLRVYLSGCRQTQARELFHIAWMSEQHVVVTVQKSALSTVSDVASSSSRNAICTVKAKESGVSSIDCSELGYFRSSTEDLVFRNLAYRKEGNHILKGHGDVFEFLQKKARVDLSQQNVAGSVALFKVIEPKKQLKARKQAKAVKKTTPPKAAPALDLRAEELPKSLLETPPGEKGSAESGEPVKALSYDSDANPAEVDEDREEVAEDGYEDLVDDEGEYDEDQLLDEEDLEESEFELTRN